MSAPFPPAVDADEFLISRRLDVPRERVFAAWHDIVKPDRAPEEHNPAGEMVPLVTLDEHDGGTLLTVRIRFGSAAIRDAFAAMGIQQGRSEILARLVDASRDEVWRAFSDPEPLARWWGPRSSRPPALFSATSTPCMNSR